VLSSFVKIYVTVVFLKLKNFTRLKKLKSKITLEKISVVHVIIFIKMEISTSNK